MEQQTGCPLEQEYLAQNVNSAKAKKKKKKENKEVYKIERNFE